MNNKIMEMVSIQEQYLTRIQQLYDELNEKGRAILGTGYTPHYFYNKIQVNVEEVDPECEYDFSSTSVEGKLEYDFFSCDVHGIEIVEVISVEKSPYSGERHIS